MNNPVYKWAQVLNRQLTKRIYWQRSTERDVNITLSRNYKVKQWDTTAHLLERLKSKKKKMLVRMWSKRKHHSLLVGMKNGLPLWKAKFVKILQNKAYSYLLFSNDTPWYLSKGEEYLRPHKNLYTDAYRIVGKWINKLRSVQTMEFYLVLKSNELQKDVEES